MTDLILTPQREGLPQGCDDWQVMEGDCLALLRALPDACVDAVVTDPPYGLSFMGKKWDYDVPSVEVWQECLRVAKPGAHLLAFAGTRTQHRMAVRIEDGGFEIRDMIAWCYGVGFPKSLDVSKAIDKAAGAEREKVLVPTKPGNTRGDRGVSYAGESFSGFTDISEPATDAARQWQGWGTALKPALEPITVARKPLVGTVAANVLEHGTGAINVDGGRVGTERTVTHHNGSMGKGIYGGDRRVGSFMSNTPGRFPANLIHDGSEEVTALLGDAARFFYCAKASQVDRNDGCEELPQYSAGACTDRQEGTAGLESPRAGAGRTGGARNFHPTVKPTDLMRYLCRLVTPPGGLILDPFCGSGSTGRGAVLEGFRFLGMELAPEYAEIARARIAAAAHAAQRQPKQRRLL